MKIINICTAFAVAACLLLSASPAQAERVSNLTVTNVGCYAEPGGRDTCFAYVDQDMGPTQCRDKSVRWQGEGRNGKNVLSTFTAAYLAGKKVTVRVSDTDCLSGFPAVVWVRMD